MLRWPDEREALERLAAEGVPRLLLVDADADHPLCRDLLEDWVRLPSDDRDVRARLFGLRWRAGEATARPVVEGGRLIYRKAWVQLSPIEQALAEALSEAFNLIVAEDTLLQRGWPSRKASSNALRVHLHRLRSRIRTLGLELRAVRGQGWVLQQAGKV